MEGVVLGHEGRVDKLPDLLGGRRGLHAVQVVQRLGRRHVVRGGADAADTRSDLGHLLGRSALHELLEAPQLGDLEIGTLDLARLVEEDVDFPMSLQARDRVDADAASGVRRARPLGPFLPGALEPLVLIRHRSISPSSF